MDSPSEGRRRWRDISMRPNREIRPSWMRARSERTASRRRSSTPCWFFLDSMSMKSMTIRPPRSRIRNCRAISSAASRLVLYAVVSMSDAARRACRVDVDRDQRLGVVDHDASTRGQRDGVRVRRLDLALDLEAREERHVVAVVLDLALPVGRLESLHVLERALVRARLVDQRLADIVGKVVAQRPRDRVTFLVNQEWRRALTRGSDDGVPIGAKVIEVPLQFLRVRARRRQCGRSSPCHPARAAFRASRGLRRAPHPRCGGRRRRRAGYSASGRGSGRQG